MSASDNVVPFAADRVRRPVRHDAVLGRERSVGELVTRCQDPMHLFMTAVPGAVCQCGETTWLSPEEGAMHHES